MTKNTEAIVQQTEDLVQGCRTIRENTPPKSGDCEVQIVKTVAVAALTAATGLPIETIIS